MPITGKIRILFSGWIRIPHSYACCFCFELIHLYQKYSDQIEFYIEERPYFRKEWESAKTLVYNPEYNQILEDLMTNHKYTGQEVDLVFRQSYPYDINLHLDTNIPVCIFFTSEFGTLDINYFDLRTDSRVIDDEIIEKWLASHQNISFTCPSDWSAKGMVKYLGVANPRVQTITHGVDRLVFKPDNSKRDQIRKMYQITEEDTLMISIGSMTRNKGISQLLQLLAFRVYNKNEKNLKLLLKGTGDLYNSKLILETTLQEFKTSGFLTGDQIESLLKNHVIFTENTLSYSTLNDLFNACDVYVSPHLAEGFGLVPLEALAAGLPIIIPETGGSADYVRLLVAGGCSDYLHTIKSTVENSSGLLYNQFTLNDLDDAYQRFTETKDRNYPRLDQIIKSNLSLEIVAERLYSLFVSLTKSKMIA